MSRPHLHRIAGFEVHPAPVSRFAAFGVALVALLLLMLPEAWTRGWFGEARAIREQP